MHSTDLRLLKVWDKGGKDNIKQCLKMKIIEILNLDFVSFCLLCFAFSRGLSKD